MIITDEPTCHLPEELHLQALQMLNDHCDLHISVLHRQSGKSLFNQVLTLNGQGAMELIGGAP